MYNVSLHTPAGNFRLPAGKASAHNHMELVKLFGFENGSYLDAYLQVGTIDTIFEVNSIKRNNHLVLALLSKEGTFCHLWLRDKNSPTSGRKISRRKIPLAIVLKIDGVVDFPHKLGKGFWMKSSLECIRKVGSYVQNGENDSGSSKEKKGLKRISSLIIACRDTPEIFQATKTALYYIPALVSLPVIFPGVKQILGRWNCILGTLRDYPIICVNLLRGVE